MEIYQYKPEAQASVSNQHVLKEHTSIQALTRLRFGLVLVNSHLPLALILCVAEAVKAFLPRGLTPRCRTRFIEIIDEFRY